MTASNDLKACATAPDRAAGPLAPREDEATRLRRATMRLARQLRRSTAEEGCTAAEVSALGVLVRHGPLGLRELAAEEAVHPTMLSRVVGSLEAGGLISRTPDARDRRAAIVEATAAGRRRYEAMRAGSTAALASAVGALGEQERSALAAALPVLERLGDELRRGIR